MKRLSTLFVLLGLFQSTIVVAASRQVQVRSMDLPNKVERAVRKNYEIGRDWGDFGGVEIVDAFRVSNGSKAKLFSVLKAVIAKASEDTPSWMIRKVLKLEEEEGLPSDFWGTSSPLLECAVSAVFSEESFDKYKAYKGKVSKNFLTQCANYVHQNPEIKTRWSKRGNWMLEHLYSDYDSEGEYKNMNRYLGTIEDYLRKNIGRNYVEYKIGYSPAPSVDGEILILISSGYDKAFVVYTDWGA